MVKSLTKTKKIIISVVSVFAVLVVILGILFMVPKFSHATVEVYPVARIREYSWGNQLGTYGTVISGNSQYVYLDNELIVDEVLVSPGDRVEVGDILLKYDMTIQALQIRTMEIESEISKNNIKKVTNELNFLKELTPSEPPPEPDTPKKLITDGVELTWETASSLAVNGDGRTQDKRYVFNCLWGTEISKEFLASLYQETLIYPDDPEDDSDPDVEVTVIYIELRIFYYNNVYMAKLTVDGNEIMQISEDEMPTINTYKRISIDEQLNITKTEGKKDIGKLTLMNSTVDYYGGPHYSESQLKLMVERKENELAELTTNLRGQTLSLDAARAELDEGNVRSLINGIIVEINDYETLEIGLPLLVVYSEKGYMVEGSISELNYTKLTDGQIVTVSSWRTGSSSDAVVSDIKDFPARYASGSTGMENPINSYYSFSAMIDTKDELEVGDWVEIIIEGSSLGEPNEDEIYLPNAFIRQENGRSYVLVADSEGHLTKRFITTGRSNYGYSTEIVEGLTLEDLIAFPYGKSAKLGIMTVLAEGMYW